MTDKSATLLAELRSIARFTEELADGSPDAAGGLRAAMARVEQLAATCGDRQLRHFLHKHSYAKALDYLEQSTA